MHAGMPVRAGEKWIVTVFVRQAAPGLWEKETASAPEDAIRRRLPVVLPKGVWGGDDDGDEEEDEDDDYDDYGGDDLEGGEEGGEGAGHPMSNAARGASDEDFDSESEPDSEEVVAEAIAHGRLPVVLPRDFGLAPPPPPRRQLPVVLPAGLEHLANV